MERPVFLEIFNELLEDEGLNRKRFAELSGIPYTTVMGWTNLGRLPDYSALIKIADFFQCSVDYLTGRNDEYGYLAANKELDDTDRELLKNYHTLSTENKELILSLIKKLCK